MSDEKEPVTLVTSETKPRLDPTDAAILDQAAGRAPGLIEIKSVEQLMALAEAARATYDHFDKTINDRMTPERAQRIKHLRCVEGCTWRSVARQSHEDWGADADWSPVSNQLAGMALCSRAAEKLGEDPGAEPWN